MGDQNEPNVREGSGGYSSRNSLSSSTATESLNSHELAHVLHMLGRVSPRWTAPGTWGSWQKIQSRHDISHVRSLRGQRTADSGQKASVAMHQLGSALLPQRRIVACPTPGHWVRFSCRVHRLHGRQISRCLRAGLENTLVPASEVKSMT